MERFFEELARAGIDHLDLAICRGPERKFQLRNLAGLSVEKVLRRCRWLRWENRQGADIYFRPAKHLAWPIIFLDDLTGDQAAEMARNFQCWLIETSPGRHHVWILADRRLEVRERFLEQKNFISQGLGDPGSASGDHLGRPPGLRNWKRGTWVDHISSPGPDLPLFHPVGARVLRSTPDEPKKAPRKNREKGVKNVDSSESGKEFGWTCGWLRAGLDPREAIRRLAIRAAGRGKSSPEVYATRTVEAALHAITHSRTS